MGLLKFKGRVPLLLAAVLVLASCNRTPEAPAQQKETGKALGTYYSIIYEVPHDSISYHEDILEVFDTVNASMSTYIPTSDISRINKGDTTVVIDSYFQEVLRTSREVWKNTNGVFDPTVGALVNAWGFGPDAGLEHPDAAQIDSILAFTGLDKVAVDSLGRVVKEHPSVFLDFNALAKGYCIDLIGRALEARGVQNYLIEVGGEILAKGMNTRRAKDWVVAIDSPEQEGEDRQLISRITLRDRAMATSGNYRKFRVDEETGEKYVHTIDPRTGYPFKNTVLSTSVIASNCMEADAYATAFMVMPLDSIKTFLRDFPQYDAYIISLGPDGELEEFYTAGFEAMLVK